MQNDNYRLNPLSRGVAESISAARRIEPGVSDGRRSIQESEQPGGGGSRDTLAGPAPGRGRDFLSEVDRILARKDAGVEYDDLRREGVGGTSVGVGEVAHADDMEPFMVRGREWCCRLEEIVAVETVLNPCQNAACRINEQFRCYVLSVCMRVRSITGRMRKTDCYCSFVHVRAPTHNARTCIHSPIHTCTHHRPGMCAAPSSFMNMHTIAAAPLPQIDVHVKFSWPRHPGAGGAPNGRDGSC